jgi:hypothetical protein
MRFHLIHCRCRCLLILASLASFLVSVYIMVCLACLVDESKGLLTLGGDPGGAPPHSVGGGGGSQQEHKRTRAGLMRSPKPSGTRLYAPGGWRTKTPLPAGSIGRSAVRAHF